MRPVVLTLSLAAAAAAVSGVSAQTRPAPNIGALNQPPAYAKTLQVRVFGVRGRFGKIIVQLCDQTYFPDRCTLYGGGTRREHIVASTQPSEPETTVNVHVPDPGRYAVQVWHDRNGNGVLDRGEGSGFGNGAVGDEGRPPSFEAASVEMGEQPLQTDVTLAYGPR